MNDLFNDSLLGTACVQVNRVKKEIACESMIGVPFVVEGKMAEEQSEDVDANRPDIYRMIVEGSGEHFWCFEAQSACVCEQLLHCEYLGYREIDDLDRHCVWVVHYIVR